MKHVPNALTVARGVVGIGILGLYLLTLMGFWATAAWVGMFALYVGAGVSDAVDGPIARNNGWVSEFGKTADPVADKFLFWPSAITMWGEISSLLSPEIRRIAIGFAIVVALYDAGTTLLRVLKSRGIIGTMHTTSLAKGKTIYLLVGQGIFFGIQVIALWVPTLPVAFFPFFIFVYTVIGSILTIASAIAYLRLSLLTRATPAPA